MKLPFINTKPVRLIELFGGIDSQAMALTRLWLACCKTVFLKEDKNNETN